MKTRQCGENMRGFSWDVPGQVHRNLLVVPAEGSGVDILVEFSEVPGISGTLRLERNLPEILGRKVDLVEESALKPRIGRRARKEVLHI